MPPAKEYKQRRKVQGGKEDRGGEREMRWRNGGKNRRERELVWDGGRNVIRTNKLTTF